MCLVLVGHPLDLIKVKLQTGDQYKGMADVAAQTLKKEGVSNGAYTRLHCIALHRCLARMHLQRALVLSCCHYGCNFARTLTCLDLALLTCILQLRGFYRGVSAPLVGVSPIFAVCFWGYDMGMRFMVRPLRLHEVALT
jgi:hypothetical protein